VFVFVQLERILLLLALIGATACASAFLSGSARALEAYGGEARSGQILPERRLPRLGAPMPTQEPVALQPLTASPSDETSELSVKWAELQSRILVEVRAVAACRSGDGPCSSTAQRFLSIVELARQRQGRVQLAEVNRAVNLSIKPISDWAQYGVDDYWTAPLATLAAEAGDCEDYAIVKYVALYEAGILPDDLRLLIVRDIKRQAIHAVVAVQRDEQWLILDNRTMIMVDAEEARHYHPLFVLDHTGVRPFATLLARR